MLRYGTSSMDQKKPIPREKNTTQEAFGHTWGAPGMSQTENCPYTWLFSGVWVNYYTRVVNCMVQAIYYTRVVIQVYNCLCEPYIIAMLYGMSPMYPT